MYLHDGPEQVGKVLVQRLVLLVEEEIVAGGLHRLKAGLEKNPGLNKKTSPVGFGVFLVVWGFFGFFYILPEESF